MNAQYWNTLIAGFPKPHILQTYQWGEVKKGFGWQPHFLELPGNDSDAHDAAAMVLVRQIKFWGLAVPFTIAYVPKGPLFQSLDFENSVPYVLKSLIDFARSQNSIFVKIDPDILIGEGENESDTNESGTAFINRLRQDGWTFSASQIQFRNTVLIDLTDDEELLLARMKQKTRYNIRLAERKGVVVRIGGLTDIDLLYDMYRETASRDGFIIREKAYYSKVWQTYFRASDTPFPDSGNEPFAVPYIASFDGEPIAAIIVFYFAGRAWYLYGMSLNKHRNKMPNYLLQWKAMCHARQLGVKEYDLWGAPDNFNEDDPMWGVYRFKTGFGGKTIRTIGAWDYPVMPIWYRFYTRLIPLVLNLMRRSQERDMNI